MIRRAWHREVLAQIDIGAGEVVAEVGDAVKCRHTGDVASARAREEVVVAAVGIDRHPGVQHVAIGSKSGRRAGVEALIDRRKFLSLPARTCISRKPADVSILSHGRGANVT